MTVPVNGLAICKYKKCKKSKQCKRYLQQNGVEIEFKNICKKPNYEWFVETEQSLTVQKE